ncbi:MAG: T9SS type A sorting domain-containing protein [Flavobacteriaceae bacterium]|nr:T9SS type A sorting domain-containing protein [Flavobacteriaceae bacterium]
MKPPHQKFRLFLLATILSMISTFKINAQPPLFDQWESNMTTWGDHWGIYLQTYDPPTNGGMYEHNGIYYDGQRVFFQIANYTGQAEPWNTHAQEAEHVYRVYLDNRTNYNGTIPWFVQGWRRFSHGIAMDAERTAGPISVEGVLRIRDNGSYANVLTSSYTAGWYYERRSREMAYMISAHVNAEKFGYERQEEALAIYIAMAMKHLDEWITETYASPDSHRLSPFMVGLTAEALIEFYEWEIANERDPSVLFTHPSVTYTPTRTVPEALQQVAYHMRYTATVESGDNAGKSMWVEDMSGYSYATWGDEGGTGYSALRYESINSASPAPALNLLICPLYAWVFKQTGDLDYINIGDKLWEAGVATTNVGWNTKTFNQNYRWSFDYIKWRNEGMQALNIDEVEESEINIYPNPATNTFTINLKNETLKKVIVYNQLGQQIKKATTNEVNISNLSNGIYFVRITSQSGNVITKKLIKK